MHPRKPFLSKDYLLAAIIISCLCHATPSRALEINNASHTFKMIDLHTNTTLTTSQDPARDPFNWPTSQRVRLRQIAEAEQDIFVDFTLQGIIWDKKKPQAIVNNELVTIGDMVDGALITSINETRVSLKKNARTHALQFDTFDIDFGSQPYGKGNADDTK